MPEINIYEVICNQIIAIHDNSEFFQFNSNDVRVMAFDRFKYVIPNKLARLVTRDNFQDVREMVADELFDFSTRYPQVIDLIKDVDFNPEKYAQLTGGE